MNIEGTHMGKLSGEARERRRVKNARRLGRVHPTGAQHKFDMPAPGSSKRVHTRLFTKGNRETRGKS